LRQGCSSVCSFFFPVLYLPPAFGLFGSFISRRHLTAVSSPPKDGIRKSNSIVLTGGPTSPNLQCCKDFLDLRIAN